MNIQTGAELPKIPCRPGYYLCRESMIGDERRYHRDELQYKVAMTYFCWQKF